MLSYHSYYSFRYGTCSPADVLDRAVANDYDVVALTDINSTAGSLNFVRMASKKGVKPVLGIDFRNGAKQCFLALAKNNKGWEEINTYLSYFLHSGEPIPKKAPHFKHVIVIYPFISAPLDNRNVDSETRPSDSPLGAGGAHKPAISAPLDNRNLNSETRAAGSPLGAGGAHKPAISAPLDNRNVDSETRPSDSPLGAGGTHKPVISASLDNRNVDSETRAAGSPLGGGGAHKPAISASLDNRNVDSETRPSDSPLGAGGAAPHGRLATRDSRLKGSRTKDLQLAAYSLQPNEYISVAPRDLIRFTRSPWAKHIDKVVMGHQFSFANKREFNAHRLLRAIANNCLLSKLPKTEEGHPDDVWMHRNEVMALYGEFPQIIANTTRILQECRINFEFGDAYPHKNLRLYTDSLAEDEAMLRRLCMENLDYRYPDADDTVMKRLNMELEVISQKQFVSYFLINWDITSYARSKGYFYVGRGSGANSLVAYVLRITDVDPIELDLYFERFINLYRKNPPDFDLDFSWRDRPDVTRYIFERFPHCAILATYNTFQYRAVVRELGKVFGLPKDEIDILTRGKFDASKLDGHALLVLRYSQLIQGFPSHLSLHAGGILICDAPVHKFSPTWMPPKGFPTVQFDMVVAEDIGLYKFDILGQRGLGKIKDAVAIIADNQPDASEFDIHDLKRFKKDEKIQELLRNGDAIGCFYVESPAMRMLMKKLRVDNYLGLVAASSVIRPGVSKSGMMREFILRYRDPEKRKEAHPTMLEIMPETYGVMVYQEDVIKVAHYFAGLTLGEADVLRRGMSGKFRSREEFAKAKGKFFSNCKKKGYADSLTAEIWRQVESFAGYAFAKGHSASYAVESYQSLFLKAHFPLEYMVATINNGGGFYSREFYLHEARMKGATIVPPCINSARNECIISGREIMLGFGFLQGLEDETVYRVVKAREQKGDFKDLDDFLDRVPIGVEQIDILIRIDAFRFTGRNKRELLWEARYKIEPSSRNLEQFNLFSEPRRNCKLPNLRSTQLEDAFDQIELLGFPLCDPFDLVEPQCFANQSDPAVYPAASMRASHLPSLIGRHVTIYGYMVTARDVKTSRGDRMAFGNFVDLDGHFIDSVHFPPVLRQYPFRGRGVYKISGIVCEEFDCISIEADRLEKVALVPDARYAIDDALTKQNLLKNS